MRNALKSRAAWAFSREGAGDGALAGFLFPWDELILLRAKRVLLSVFRHGPREGLCWDSPDLQSLF